MNTSTLIDVFTRKKMDPKMNLIPRLFSFFRLIHEVKVSGMQRHKLEVQSSNSTCPNTDNFHLIVVSLLFNGEKLEDLERKQ